jgi:Glycosyltransferase family 10 (fucosyltransferase) C-term
MLYTPFGKGGDPLADRGRETLRQEGILPTENPWNCNLLVTERYPLARRAVLSASKLSALIKPILVWTHEPRYCQIFTRTVERPELTFRVHVMNVYTGDLFLNNYSFYSWAIQYPKLHIRDVVASAELRKHKIAALMKYVDRAAAGTALIKDNENLDLIPLRQEIALAGHARNLVDIYGRGWPGGMSKGSSNGRDDWHKSKVEILRSYRFNLCMENTNYNHYCTEKIWDAIHAGCLPIYYGKDNRIYDDFPRDSFLDVAEYSSVAELLDHVETMSREEYDDRIAKCIGVYNRFLETASFESEYERALLSTAHRVKSIVFGSGNEPSENGRNVPLGSTARGKRGAGIGSFTSPPER